MALKGDVRVLVRRNCCAFAALAMALALCGCGSSDFGSGWFQKPINLTGNNLGYTYSNLGETRPDRPITANDLVDANGACPRYVPPQPAAGNPGESAAAPPDASVLGGGVALGMSECEVVSRLGAPSAVNLGANPNGSRNAILTFRGGPRPGVYRFGSGRLMEMDRVAEQPPPENKTVKKKPAKTKEPPKADGNS